MKEIVITEAQRYGRESKIKFAGLIPLLSYPPSFAPKYDQKSYADAVENAVKNGLDYACA